MKFIQYRNMSLGVLGGIGYGNIRYTNTQKEKPDFPELLKSLVLMDT
ncbi:hypothetical protein V8V91_26785 [Algoriphagus halophilus]